MEFSKYFNEFFKNERTGAFLLLGATIISLFISNMPSGSAYVNFWNNKIFGHSLLHWINDGLMVIFFLLIGLELKREIIQGELSNIKKANLPIFAALGGMLFPAFIYILFNYGKETISGFGVPMATDIAFAIGILSLSAKVPPALRIFLVALAIIDDLGAIILIAVFYSKDLSLLNLSISLGIFFFLLLMGKLKIKSLPFYMISGIFMWYFMLNSGVHPTISGVLLAFAIPFKGENSPSLKLEHLLQKPVAFLVLPIFALTNTSIPLTFNFKDLFLLPHSLGIFFGLFLGKPFGIFLFSYLSEKLKISLLPENLYWKDIFSVGFLGGIGFTMAIFIALLGFNDLNTVNTAKISIMLASLFSGITGLIFLNLFGRK